MELAFVLLFVLVGVGIIAYAGMRTPQKNTRASSGGDNPIMPVSHRDGDIADSGGGDGGGGGGGD